METGPRFIVPSDGLEKPGIELLDEGPHGRIQRGGTGGLEPPWNCQIIDFCHVEKSFRQNPSGNFTLIGQAVSEKILRSVYG